MIESYAFLAAFAVQILVTSVLYPAWLIKYVRGWATDFGSERFAQMYPGVDYLRWAERFATRYRAVTIVIAVLGGLLLGWLFSDLRRQDWDGDANNVACLYGVLQMSPLALLALYAVVRLKVLDQPPLPDGKRRAILQRRGLFDFISPFVVFIAGVSYFLFAAFAIYIDLHIYKNASLSKYCYGSIGVVTAIYLLDAFIIYKQLYGRKNPLVTQEGRAHTIGMGVKSSVYGSIVCVWFLMLLVTLKALHLQRWEPVVVSLFFVACSLICLIGLTAPPSKSEADGLGSSQATPLARDLSA